MSDDIQKELKRLTRRGFITAAVAAGAGYAGYKWLRTRPREGGVEWPMRRVLQANESVSSAYFSSARLSPEFDRNDVTRARINGRLGLQSALDASQWRLRIEGAAQPVALTLDEIRSLPRHEMITELRCIEGWSTIVQWTGARLADVLGSHPPQHDSRFVGIETPDRGYYVGLDMESALH